MATYAHYANCILRNRLLLGGFGKGTFINDVIKIAQKEGSIVTTCVTMGLDV